MRIMWMSIISSNSYRWQVSMLFFSCSVISDSLWPHGLQHTRLPCPSPSPGACSNSCPLSWWCHPTISFSVVPFSCLQSFPASGSFPMSLLFTWDDQSIGTSASALVLPMNIQGWLLLGLIDSFDPSSVFSSTTVWSINSLVFNLYDPTLASIHDYWESV